MPRFVMRSTTLLVLPCLYSLAVRDRPAEGARPSSLDRVEPESSPGAGWA